MSPEREKGMFTAILCRYHEIATKGENRRMFEEKLIENIKYHLAPVPDFVCSRVRGRIYVRKKENRAFSDRETGFIRKALHRCAGLETFSPAVECAPSMEAILDLLKRSIGPYFDPVIAGKGTVRFRIRARRSDKSFPLVSREIEIACATAVDEVYGEEKLKVDLEDPDVSIGVEVRDVNALIYFETVHGAGGLPVGSNGPVLALLSGGIDSPVACKMIMTRGCHVDYLTFHSYPYTPMASLEKVRKIAAELNRHQKPGTLYACNLSEIQKKIRDTCNPRFRTVLYRRMMMRIANMICWQKRLNAIVTGEAVGQVASQTITNLSTIDQTAEFVMLRPLCGMDKIETIRRAEQLGTYDLSIVDLPDSCTVFAPPNPAVAARPGQIRYEEGLMGDFSPLLEEAYSSMEITVDKPAEEY